MARRYLLNLIYILEQHGCFSASSLSRHEQVALGKRLVNYMFVYGKYPIPPFRKATSSSVMRHAPLMCSSSLILTAAPPKNRRPREKMPQARSESRIARSK